MTRLRVGSSACTCGRTSHDTRLIAVTGGPGAGKTAILELALRSFCNHVGVLPEAASVVFGGGFPRHESDVARRSAQRAIFHVQREVEALVLGEKQVAVGLCDRGTIDGAAYWPGPVETYWSELGATLEQELSRYSAVIHLRTPGVEQGYNHDNALRLETAAEAQEIDRRIEALWASHPKRFLVPSDDEFVRKATRTLEIVRAELIDCCRPQALHE